MGFIDPLKPYRREVSALHTALHTVYWGIGAVEGIAHGIGTVSLYGSLCILTIAVHFINEE